MSEGHKQKLSNIKETGRWSLERARTRTTNPEPYDRYAWLRTSLQEYNRRLWHKKGAITTRVRKLLEKHPGETIRVLDFGCGANQAMRELKQELGEVPVEVTGISVGDLRTPEEKRFDKKHRITFIDQKNLTFRPDEKYHLIVSHLAFHSLPDPLRTLKELYVALEQGGVLRVFMVPSDINWSNRDDAEEAITDLVQRARASGIKISYDSDKALLTLRKNKKPLRFPNVQYEPSKDGKVEIYRFVE
ncbi:class I SAM-dependent methyltransferase [Patescibacteria group bacterium]|nr:class I SAM-dependent methyltransferase [Patescibacteria group bacterium]